MPAQTAAPDQTIDLSAGLEPKIQASSTPLVSADQSSGIDLSAGLEPIQTTAPQTTEQPGILSRTWDATKQYAESSLPVTVAKSVVTPPTDHKEELAMTIGGLPALQAYRASKTLVGGVENVIKAPGENYAKAKADFQRGLQDFQSRDYRNFASDAASTSAEIAGAMSPGTSFITDRARELSEGVRPGGDLITPVVKTVGDVGTAALLENAPGIVNKLKGAPATAPELVGQITQATGRDVETAANALKSVDTSGVKTFKDLNDLLDNQVRLNTGKVDAALGKYNDTFKPADLETRTPVEGRTDIVSSPINDAMDQLQDFYVKTKDAANQAKIESLQTKLESNGLTVKDLNDLARQHGRDLNAYNVNGELASGLSKQAAENTRQGVKDIVRKLTPDEATKSLDKNTSDLITTREMISDMNDKVQALQNKFQKAGLVQKVGTGVGKIVDWGTQGLFKGMFKSVVGAAEQEGRTLNVIQIENNLRKNLNLLDRLNNIDPAAAYRQLQQMNTGALVGAKPGESENLQP